MLTPPELAGQGNNLQTSVATTPRKGELPTPKVGERKLAMEAIYFLITIPIGMAMMQRMIYRLFPTN